MTHHDIIKFYRSGDAFGEFSEFRGVSDPPHGWRVADNGALLPAAEVASSVHE